MSRLNKTEEIIELAMMFQNSFYKSDINMLNIILVFKFHTFDNKFRLFNYPKITHRNFALKKRV